jgi:hypothetical protein
MKDSYPPGRREPPPERWPPGRSDDAWGQVPSWDNPAALLPHFSYRRPQRPRSIQIAVALMRVSAAGLLGLGVIPSLMSGGGSGLFMGLNGIIGSAPGAALWWWMALANKAGNRWARTTATVYFGINALGGIIAWLEVAHLGAFSASAFAATTGFYLVVGLGVLLLGLTTIVLLWRRESSDYYDAMSAFT